MFLALSHHCYLYNLLFLFMVLLFYTFFKLLHEDSLWRLKESFLQAVSGQIGKNNVSDYMQLLRDAGELCDDSYFKLLFRQSLFASGDIWRRCCLSTMSFPFCMFGLIREEYTVPEFLSLWANLMKVKELCKHCVAAEFSLPLLVYFWLISNLTLPMPPTQAPELKQAGHAHKILPLTWSDIYQRQWLDKEGERFHGSLQDLSMQTKDVAIKVLEIVSAVQKKRSRNEQPTENVGGTSPGTPRQGSQARLTPPSL
jgi:hypothetical protein